MFPRPTNSEEQTDENDFVYTLFQYHFRYFVHGFLYYFHIILTAFYYLLVSFGIVLARHFSGALGLKAGTMNPRGRIGGEFVLQIGAHLEEQNIILL